MHCYFVCWLLLVVVGELSLQWTHTCSRRFARVFDEITIDCCAMLCHLGSMEFWQDCGWWASNPRLITSTLWQNGLSCRKICQELSRNILPVRVQRHKMCLSVSRQGQGEREAIEWESESVEIGQEGGGRREEKGSGTRAANSHFFAQLRCFQLLRKGEKHTWVDYGEEVSQDVRYFACCVLLQDVTICCGFCSLNLGKKRSTTRMSRFLKRERRRSSVGTPSGPFSPKWRRLAMALVPSLVVSTPIMFGFQQLSIVEVLAF